MANEQFVLSINPSKKTKALGDLFGVFFEDLNHAADGGLYAEMVRNRSFEFDAVDNPGYNAMTAWQKVVRGDAVTLPHVETAHPLNDRNPHYLVVEITRAGRGGGVLNEGYAGGMRVEAGKAYHFSCWYHRRSTAMARLCIALETEDGETLTEPASFLPESRDWAQIKLTLRARKNGTARLTIVSEGVQTFCLDMVSLFPEDTFLGRENGLRRDIAELIADMKPKFLRFPGGCLVHCGSLDSSDRCSQYCWKNTLGDLEQRPARRNSWGYNQTFGLGYYEFFCFCEDIGAQPLPVLSAGWDPHALRAVPMEELGEWIDDALDLVEFANGGAETRWGGERARMGHPEPFGLKYLGIGNEEVGDPFFERFAVIHQAVKQRYPDIQLIGTAGASCSGEVFEQGWEAARKAGSSFVDEHYYQSTQWFETNMHRYEAYSNDQPKVFLGEYASRDDKYHNALVEAAYMTGMEKAPAVGLACYAPMLCNADYVNWKPDMIWFDSQKAYGTACYQVQKLFMNHQGDHEVSSVLNGALDEPRVSVTGEGGLIFHATDPIELSDVLVTNLDSAETLRYEDFRLHADASEHALGDIAWTRYTLAFTAVRHFNAIAEFPNALEVRFGVKDDNNYQKWIIDGWSQVSSLALVLDGGYSDAGMYYAPAPSDQPVCYLLTVDNGTVTLTVNDVCHARLRNEYPTKDVLYFAASVESSTGDVILKAVNLRPETTEVWLNAPELVGCPATLWRLSGYRPEDANSFDEPEKICPIEETVVGLPSMLCLAPESVNVYRIHKRRA